MKTRHVHEGISGKYATVVDTSRNPHPWWWRVFTSEGRRFSRWERSLTNEYGWTRGGVFTFKARRIKR